MTCRRSQVRVLYRAPEKAPCRYVRQGAFLLFPRMQASASACRDRCSSSTRELNNYRRAGRAAPRPYNALFVSPLTNLRWYDILIFYGILSYFVQSRNRAIPHNSKCRYGERGTAAAKPKAQIILCVLSSILATQMPCRSRRSGA